MSCRWITMLFSREFLLITSILISLLQCLVSENVLASAPNINVLLTDVIFMELVTPQPISYTYKLRPAKDFGVPFQNSYRNIDLVLGEPFHGCATLRNTFSLRNKIVLLERGECSFVTKSLHAEEAGALGVVVTDNNAQNDDMYIDMVNDNTDRLVSIPSVFMLGKDGYMIRNTLEQLGELSALVNIPINVTGSTAQLVKQPPWTLW